MVPGSASPLFCKKYQYNSLCQILKEFDRHSITRTLIEVSEIWKAS